MASSAKLCLLMLSCLLATTMVSSRRSVNCGLTCYRWNKCMGVFDSGEKRPGQLGDTGIIVLEHCTPLLKGCKCELDSKEKTTTTTTTTTTTHRPQTTRRPRSLLYRSRYSTRLRHRAQ